MNKLSLTKSASKTSSADSPPVAKLKTGSSGSKSNPKNSKRPKRPVNIAKAISDSLYRFHVVIFVVLVLGGIAIVIFMLNQTLTSATQIIDDQTATGSTFDTETIERLNQLDDNPGQSRFQLPPGRTNPFAE